MAHNGSHSSHIYAGRQSRSITDRRFAQGGRARNTRGQGSHGHPIHTEAIQWAIGNHRHATGPYGGYGDLQDDIGWTGEAMIQGEDDGSTYFDDDVGFAYTAGGSGGHMGHRNFR